MASDDKKPSHPDDPPLSPIPSTWGTVKDRILIPTLIGGMAGGAFGSVSKHKKIHGLAKMSSTYASNFAIVTGCYCGARESIRVSRAGKPDDLLNSTVGGFCSGAVLGRLQGGPVGAARYSVAFAVVGTTVDYAALKLMPSLKEFMEKKDSWLRMPEWSPIQVLDEEALAAKQAREQQRHTLHKGKS